MSTLKIGGSGGGGKRGRLKGGKATEVWQGGRSNLKAEGERRKKSKGEEIKNKNKVLIFFFFFWGGGEV